MHKLDEYITELGYEIIDYRTAVAGDVYFTGGQAHTWNSRKNKSIRNSVYRYPILSKLKPPIKAGDWCVVWDKYIPKKDCPCVRQIGLVNDHQRWKYTTTSGADWQNAQLLTEWLEEIA